MRQLLALALPLGLALCAGLRGAEIPAEVKNQIAQLKADAEAAKDMPATLPGVVVVTTEEAAKLFKSKSAIFLDNRVKAQYDTERIEGAQWFFCDDLLKDPSLATKLDKTKKYVVYCNGGHCWRSPATALVLKSQGYDNVVWYHDGLPAWKKAALPTE